MRAVEFVRKESHRISEQKLTEMNILIAEKRLDEILPILAAGAAAAGRAVGSLALKGAQAAGQGLVKGAQAAGSAIKQGAQTLAKNAPAAANGIKQVAAIGTTGPGEPNQNTQGQQQVSPSQEKQTPQQQQNQKQQQQDQQKLQQQAQQQQQQNKEALVNLDKIAAQIVGLKQQLSKQQ